MNKVRSRSHESLGNYKDIESKNEKTLIKLPDIKINKNEKNKIGYKPPAPKYPKMRNINIEQNDENDLKEIQKGCKIRSRSNNTKYN